MLSMKFPHLFLRPEIIITVCGDGSGVEGRCDTALRGILVNKLFRLMFIKMSTSLFLFLYAFSFSFLCLISEPLTPDFMRLLCRDLRNDWERFAKELHIGRARIQSIKQQNKTTIPEKIIMDILASWMKRQPKVSDKVL